MLRPIDEADVDQQEKEAIDRTIALLTAIRDEPGASLGALATATSIPKSSVDRTLKSLAKPASGKLVKKTLDKWTLTPAGHEAIEAPK